MQLLTVLFKDKKILLLLILIVLFAILILFLKFNKKGSPIQPFQPVPISESSKQIKIQKSNPATIVEINKTRFFPQTIQIKQGTQVTWINNDTKPHQIKSDPHPLDNLYSFLNTDEKLMQGEEVTITFEKTGTFTYHDELNPLSFKGIIIVK